MSWSPGNSETFGDKNNCISTITIARPQRNRSETVACGLSVEDVLTVNWWNSVFSLVISRSNIEQEKDQPTGTLIYKSCALDSHCLEVNKWSYCDPLKMRFPFESEDTMVQLSIYIHFCGTKILIRKKIELWFFSLTHDEISKHWIST